MAKASDNKFPKVIITEGSAPSNADAGDQKLYIDSADHKLKRKDSSGTVVTIETAGGVARSGATTDGHLAVWNGSSADSIKDGGAVPAGGGGDFLVMQVFS